MPPGFCICSLTPKTSVTELEGQVPDPDWSWTAPDGRVCRWIDGGNRGVTFCQWKRWATTEVDEDGEPIYYSGYFLDGVGAEVRPGYRHGKIVVQGRTEFTGTFVCPGVVPIDGAKFDAPWLASTVIGIIIVSFDVTQDDTRTTSRGTFVCDGVRN